MPGPPFAFGAILVILALMVAVFIPDIPRNQPLKSPTRRAAPFQQLEMSQRNPGEKTTNGVVHAVE